MPRRQPAACLRYAFEATAPESEEADALSARELEVLSFVAAGDTNRSIADRLVVSPFTVKKHLENIYRKLGVGTRTAAVSCARERGLL